MTILDGKKFSNDILEELKEKVAKHKEETGKIPGLAVIIVGENPASQIYVRSKVRACEKVGIKSEKITFPADTTEEELLNKIKELNNDPSMNGILVQLPLPKHMDEKKVCNTIATEKDVDGFKPESLGKLLIGEEDGYIPCTPQGIMYLLDQTNVDLYGKTAVIIGRSNIVGKPVAGLLINRGATTTVCNSRTKNLDEKLRDADIIVAALGSANFVKGNMVKEGAIIIDVGINRVDKKLYGDVDFEEVSKKASYITPVPGGVGPMTIAMLLKNTLKSFEKEGDN
ncbi:bifunctional methylenetetrahydrofolate dehydrogenase/methenyltetrahydrofolate cyclohydrolase FolD [Fusobacterium sp. MFO224]|uniref:bifunctional methylenetetrahydrofolate dehydrogenase/methenyltetrahydrofolate cyclohydrolase FolD n=1 Tax=Fusobacterium sp. MFO224 TaxID=3378070 RepID=UPI003852FA51